MASFKSYQDYEEAKREWLDVPHAVYIQKTGSCVQMTGNEPLVFNDPTVASIIGTMSYNAVSNSESKQQVQKHHNKEFQGVQTFQVHIRHRGKGI